MRAEAGTKQNPHELPLAAARGLCCEQTASSSDWADRDVFCRQTTSATAPPNEGKVGEGFCCFLIFFFTLHKYVSC